MSEIEKSLQELKDEAKSLGLDIKGLKSKVEVSTVIEQHYENLAAESFVETREEVQEAKPKADRVKPIELIAKELWAEGLKTRVVTITNNDKRDNHVTTTCYLSCENAYKGISKIVPLGEKVELEKCLIDSAKAVEIVQHVDEIVDGKRTGNRTNKLIKKYVISYEDVQ